MSGRWCWALTPREAVTPPEQTDVTRLESLRVAFDFAVRTFGRPPDIVCANAGVSGNDRFEIDDEIGACPSSG